MPKDPLSVNLLKKSTEENVHQAVSWTLTIGRVMIITVEIIALIALVYRFSLDIQLRDLHTKIKEKQVILETQKDNETKYRNLQDRLAVAKEFSDKGAENSKIFKDILSFTPEGMTFTSVFLSEGTIRVEADINSVSPLTSFVNSLRDYPEVESISIDRIENKTLSAVISVAISATLKNPQEETNNNPASEGGNNEFTDN